MSEKFYQLEIPQEELKSDFDACRDVVYGVIQRINDSKELRPKSAGERIIEEDGLRLSAPVDRLGKHAVVYILDLDREGKHFDCVLRNSVTDAEEYKKAIEKKPIVKKFLPELYDIKDGWVIMERLHGLEFDIKEKIKEKDFRAHFAENCAEAVHVLTTNNIAISDVNFTNGHNVIAQEDGSFKFVEQVSLRPEFYESLKFETNEMLSKEIFDHLKDWKLLNKDSENKLELDSENDHLYDFEFQFIDALFNKVNPEELFIKYRYLASSHEHYSSSFNSYQVNHDFWKSRDFREFEDGEYETLEDSHKPELPWVGNFYPRSKSGTAGTMLNPDFIEAIKNHDIETFKALIYRQEAVIPMEDVEENRVVLK